MKLSQEGTQASIFSPGGEDAGLLLHQPKGFLMPPSQELGCQAHGLSSQLKASVEPPRGPWGPGRAPPARDSLGFSAGAGVGPARGRPAAPLLPPSQKRALGPTGIIQWCPSSFGGGLLGRRAYM